MKKTLLAVLIMGCAFANFAQDVKPVWELGKNPLDKKLIKGNVKVKDEVVKVDGVNLFSLPATVLGKQVDYTIEFEVKRPKGADNKDKIILVSNTDDKNKTGIQLNYYPPSYNCAWLFTNGHHTVEYRGFLNDKFNKITIVSKSSQLMLFRDGLLIATTGECKASKLPLTFGGMVKGKTKPYELRNIKIYQTAMLPSGFDPNAKRMRYVSGDQYFMQRVKIEDPKLPRILIIGDSISMGYRPHITEHFKGKANVDYWTIGYKSMQGANSPMERALKGVLSQGPYDAVTFNFGLHYWGKPERSPEDKHIPWMTKIVELMQKTSPKTDFIWIRTTPWRTVPAPEPRTLDPKKNERIIKFNKMTDEVMDKHGIPQVDLYSLCIKQLQTIKKGTKDALHWGRENSKLMAVEINKEIEKALKKKAK